MGHHQVQPQSRGIVGQAGVEHQLCVQFKRLNRAALLVLDDFLLTPTTVAQTRDLLEVIEDRSQLVR